MKTKQTLPNLQTALNYFTRKTASLTMIAILVSTSYFQSFGADKVSQLDMLGVTSTTTNASSDWVSLKGTAQNQTDVLQWEVRDLAGIVCFTIECCKNTDGQFSELISIHPIDCMEMGKSTAFKYETSNYDGEHEFFYYRIKVVYQDKHCMESNVVCVKKSDATGNLDISEIKNQGGQISLIFNSPKEQSITLNIINKSGQVLSAQNMIASKGDNTYSYDASMIQKSEMLIFALNNQDELITKKYMSTAW